MFSHNLIQLRKLHHLSQEQLAEKLGVSRQTVSKWETGESSPDLTMSRSLAELFDISLDELAASENIPAVHGLPPQGKHAFGVVTVGDKGQIVIPARARRIFNICPGDRLMVLGDENQGLALLKEKALMEMLKLLREQEEE